MAAANHHGSVAGGSASIDSNDAMPWLYPSSFSSVSGSRKNSDTNEHEHHGQYFALAKLRSYTSLLP